MPGRRAVGGRTRIGPGRRTRTGRARRRIGAARADSAPAGSGALSERTTSSSASLRAALGLAGALLGLLDAALHLLEPALLGFFFGADALQAFGRGGALFGGLGPLVDLAQAALGFLHRALARFAAFLQALLGEAQVGGRRGLGVGAGAGGATGGGPGTAAQPPGRTPASGLRLRRGRRAEGIDRRGGLRLEALGLLHPAIGLGPDPLLLLAHFGNFVTDPLFGGGRVRSVGADSGRGRSGPAGGGSWVGSGGGGARGRRGSATFSSTGAAGGGVGASTVGGGRRRR